MSDFGFTEYRIVFKNTGKSKVDHPDTEMQYFFGTCDQDAVDYFYYGVRPTMPYYQAYLTKGAELLDCRNKNPVLYRVSNGSSYKVV